jgi:hypothetical protein
MGMKEMTTITQKEISMKKKTDSKISISSDLFICHMSLHVIVVHDIFWLTRTKGVV